MPELSRFSACVVAMFCKDHWAELKQAWGDARAERPLKPIKPLEWMPCWSTWSK